MNRKFYEVPKRILLIVAFVAFFYTGLGCALFLAGVIFIIRYLKK